MPKPTSYCEEVWQMEPGNVHIHYHDNEYGFPIHDDNWLDMHHPMTKDEWVQLFKKIFRFTGGEIVNEFLLSTGYLPGAHIEQCPVYKKVLKQKPAWIKGKRLGVG